jgi:ribosomal protein S11
VSACPTYTREHASNEAWLLGVGAAEGYRGSRKKTPFAGQLAAEKAVEKALALGVRSLRVRCDAAKHILFS